MKVIKIKNFINNNNYFKLITIDRDEDICFFKNGKKHREDGAAIIYYGGYKRWHYNGKYYGESDYFIYKSWKKKVKELKREEKLKIFK